MSILPAVLLALTLCADDCRYAPPHGNWRITWTRTGDTATATLQAYTRESFSGSYHSRKWRGMFVWDLDNREFQVMARKTGNHEIYQFIFDIESVSRDKIILRERTWPYQRVIMRRE